MADLLGITGLIRGYESKNVGTNPSAAQTNANIQRVIDPTRVIRSNPRTDQEQSGSLAGNQLRYDTNFQAFIERLNEYPELITIFSSILEGSGTAATSALSEKLLEDISQLLNLAPLNADELLVMLKEQSSGGSRFGGALFTVLSKAYFAQRSKEARTDILQFTKRYSDFSATAHIERNLMRNIRKMTELMPARYAGTLAEMAGKLENGIAAGDRSGNIKLLQGQIFPYMADYIERTHNMGTVRTLLSMLMLDTARYESGAEQGVLQAFAHLREDKSLKGKLGGLDDETFLRFLNQVRINESTDKSGFSGQLAKVLASALDNKSDKDMQAGAKGMLSAMLTYESVFMSVNHYIIPMQWNGQLMLSELWADPDAEGDDNTRREADAPRTLRFLLKMDVQGLGMFDVVLANREQQVDILVLCPDKVAPFSGQVESALVRILSNNGFTAGTVHVEQMNQPLTVFSVFPKLLEGKNSVNVKI